MDDLVILSSKINKIHATAFGGGQAKCILGSSEIDLRNATLQAGISQLDIACTLGELTIVVPENWKVVVEASPMLGEVNDKRYHRIPQNEDNILVIKGYALLGEVKIRS